MDDDSERMIYIALGPLAAMALGVLLIPVRGFTTASNFTYIFLVLTIVVAEFGGRGAAVATALTSALSLDFFLTQPYLTLEIADKHDLIAFVGLAVCGLVAAGLGAKRGERRADLREMRKHRDLLRAALVELDAREALEYRVKTLLDACRSVLPLSAMVLRDGGNQVVAASPITRAVPETVLRQDDPLPIDVSDRDQHRAPTTVTGRRAPGPHGCRPAGRLAGCVGRQGIGKRRRAPYALRHGAGAGCDAGPPQRIHARPTGHNARSMRFPTSRLPAVESPATHVLPQPTALAVN